MKKTIKGFLIGVIITTLLMSTVFGAQVKKTIEVVYNSVNLTVNGNKVNADNILYNGTTYVPLRAVAEALGKDVGWEQSTYTASINDKLNKDGVIRLDAITVSGKEYKASYFGKTNMDWSEDYKFREFWRLENAYEDLKHNMTNKQVLPYDNYPSSMIIEKGQVFVIDYTKTDGSVERRYTRSDYIFWNGMLVTTEFVLD